MGEPRRLRLFAGPVNGTAGIDPKRIAPAIEFCMNSVLGDIVAPEVAISDCLTTNARRSVVIFAATHGESMQSASCFCSAFVLPPCSYLGHRQDVLPAALARQREFDWPRRDSCRLPS